MRLTRRDALALAAATIAMPKAGWAASALVPQGSGFAAVVDADAAPRPVFEAGRWCEGPVWWRGALTFSDVRRDRLLRLGQDGTATPLRDPSGFGNGNAVDAQGRLLTCEQGRRRVVRQEPDGTLTVLAERFEGKRLNSPNDLVVARDGAIWFTDPTYGLVQPEEGRRATPELPGRFVFRLDPDGRLAVVADGFAQPNGLAFSPDERVLYVSETGGALNPEGAREIRAFTVDGGRLTGERLFARLSSGVPDGLKTDVDGRLYAATDAGARIWAPDGTPLGLIATPAPCGNLAFGGADGRQLYLCNGSSIHSITLKVRGAAWRA